MADLFNKLTEARPTLRTACSKCNLPLEDHDHMKIGLGATCIKNVEKVFNSEIKQCQGVGQDTWFNFVTLVEGISPALTADDTESPIAYEMNDVLKRLAVAVVSLTNNGKMAKTDSAELIDVPFSIILDAFSISRNCAESLRLLIERMLIDMGFPGLVALATGDFCVGTAMVTFNSDTKRFDCAMAIRRSAAEVFNLIPGIKRPSSEFWTIPQRHGVIMLETLKLRFPLPGTLVVTSEAFEAIAEIPNLPEIEEEPKEELFRVIEQDTVVIELNKVGKEGNYLYTGAAYGSIYPFFINELKGAYNREGNNDKQFYFTVKRSLLPKIEEFVNNLELKKTAENTKSAPKSATGKRPYNRRRY